MAVAYSDFIYPCYRGSNNLNENFITGYHDRLSYYHNDAFRKYITVDLTKDRFEIPCVYKYIICGLLASNRSNQVVDVIKIPMIALRLITEESKSANPMLKDFFKQNCSGSLLSKKKCAGVDYIGGEGIIMYDDFTPLVMFTLEVQKTTVDGLVKYIPLRQIMRINPIVYTRDDLLAKHVRTHMISNVIPMKVDWSSIADTGWTWRDKKLRNLYQLFTTDKVNWDFKIIVEDFSYFFDSPTVPNCTFNSSDVNKFLSSKCNDIISGMKMT